MPKCEYLVVVDLRSPTLLALGNVGYGGQTLIASMSDGLLQAGPAIVVVVVRDELSAAAVARGLPESVCLLTERQWHAAAELRASGRYYVLLKSLFPGASAAAVYDLFAARREAIQSGDMRLPVWLVSGRGSRGSQVAGCLADLTQVADVASLSNVADEVSLREGPYLALPSESFFDLEDWSMFVRARQRTLAEQSLQWGVRLDDWESIEIKGELQCSAGVIIAGHAVFEGRVVLGEGVRIGPFTYLRDVSVGRNTEIRAFSVLEDVRIGEDCRVGPYARLRGQTTLHNRVSVGNFVELKATEVGDGGRINHMTFLGDAALDANVTIGAGVITCNHDGEKAVGTKIEAGAYVGSGTQLVAPLVVGQGATIAAGSTITDSVLPGGLTIARSRQIRVDRWLRWGKK